MDNNISTALCDLRTAIQGICLGSIEEVVIDAARRELILNWNDHHPDDKIKVDLELSKWSSFSTLDGL